MPEVGRIIKHFTVYFVIFDELLQISVYRMLILPVTIYAGYWIKAEYVLLVLVLFMVKTLSWKFTGANTEKRTFKGILPIQDFLWKNQKFLVFKNITSLYFSLFTKVFKKENR